MSTDDLPLGKTSVYIDDYSSELLRAIPRAENRLQLGIQDQSLPFHGVDIWNAYELSWLDPSGKPVVATAEISVPCESPNIIESKSLKLYFNSFNQTQFKDTSTVIEIIKKDLAKIVGVPVELKLFAEHNAGDRHTLPFPGKCLDSINAEFFDYQVNPDLLKNTGGTKSLSEVVYSHLLKTNCPVTFQPDWASVLISYQGLPIEHESLLKYIVSYRKHNEFHEQSVERIFIDIMQRCNPQQLSVYARYVRRGGIDINPYRANFAKPPGDYGQFRQ